MTVDGKKAVNAASANFLCLGGTKEMLVGGLLGRVDEGEAAEFKVEGGNDRAFGMQLALYLPWKVLIGAGCYSVHPHPSSVLPLPSSCIGRGHPHRGKVCCWLM